LTTGRHKYRRILKKSRSKIYTFLSVTINPDRPLNHLRKASGDILKSLVLENLQAQGDDLKILDLLEWILAESREPYLAVREHF
jgi:hypothetical protein